MGKLMQLGRQCAALTMAAALVALVPAPGAAVAGPDDDRATVASVLEARKALSKVADVLPPPPPTAEGGVAISGIGGSAAIGAEHTCAAVLFANVWCWGANADGQLGDGTTSAATEPVRPSPTGGLRNKLVLGITAGRAHTCALAFDFASFTAYCWGADDEGQLGDGGTASRSRPVEVANDVAGLAAGAEHTCALSLEMTVSCWGRNDVGQLGFDTGGASEPTPQEVPGLSDIVGISANENNTCAVDTHGKAYCWGSDTHGQLGDGGGASGPPSVTPQPVLMTGGNGATVADFSRPSPSAGSRTFVSVAAGGDSTCATTSRGQGYCWGANDHGQLGTGDRTGHPLPTAVDQSTVHVSAPVRMLYGVPETMIVDDTVGPAHGCATDVE